MGLATMLRTKTRKLAISGLLLIASAFLILGLINVWIPWQQSETLIHRLQREKAEVAAAKIQDYFDRVEAHLGSITHNQGAAATHSLRFEYMRAMIQIGRHEAILFNDKRLLVEQSPIFAIDQLDEIGRVKLTITNAIVEGYSNDLSADPRFTEAQRNKKYVGEVFQAFGDRPQVSFSIAHVGSNPHVTVVYVDLKRYWEYIENIRIGQSGYAYIVDRSGRIISTPLKPIASQGIATSNLPQLVIASQERVSWKPGEARTFESSLAGGPVFSVYAEVPTPGWKVFAELPLAEARAPFYGALIRGLCLISLGLLAALLASIAAANR